MSQVDKVAIALIGPRNVYNILEAESNVLFIDSVIKYLDDKYGRTNYYIVITGCDKGFSNILLLHLRKVNVNFVQIETYFSSKFGVQFGTRQDYISVFKSKYASMLELCYEFFIKRPTSYTLLDDLISRVKNSSDKPYYIYNHENVVLEYRGDSLSYIDSEEGEN